MTDETYIDVWTDTLDDEQKEALPRVVRKASKAVGVSAQVIGENLRAFLNDFRQVMAAQEDDPMFLLDEIEIGVTVNAKGGIELLGKVEGGAEASIKLKLKRKRPQ